MMRRVMIVGVVGGMIVKGVNVKKKMEMGK